MWKTIYCLTGHAFSFCEVAKFSSNLFYDSLHNQYYSILASGGLDNTLAIWKNSLEKPLVIAKDITLNSIVDLEWSDDQLLFVTSLDGSIHIIKLFNEELGSNYQVEKLIEMVNLLPQPKSIYIQALKRNEIIKVALNPINYFLKNATQINTNP